MNLENKLVDVRVEYLNANWYANKVKVREENCLKKKKRKVEMKNSEVRDWTAILDDVVGVILDKTVSLYDYLQFSMVCKSWYFAALRFKRQRLIITSKFPQLPMLIVSNSILQDQPHSLYDLRTNDIRPIRFRFPFDKRCCGSSFGWLIMLENSLHVSLFNPFSGAHILLPPINLEPDHLANVYTPPSLVKAILTKDPSLYPNDYIVVAIYRSSIRQRSNLDVVLSHELCLMKAGDRTWIYQNPQEKYFFGDINLCNDTIYAIDKDFVLRKIEVDGNSSISFKAITLEFPVDQWEREWFSFEDSYSCSVYVVESSKREVLLIGRLFSIRYENDDPLDDICYIKTGKFLIYKLSDECDENGIHQITKVESLDGDAMFIGDNQSICVPSKDFLECSSNHIYYTENCIDYFSPFIYGSLDSGVYNLDDKSFNKHYETNLVDRNLPPPIWIVPTIYFKDFKD